MQGGHYVAPTHKGKTCFRGFLGCGHDRGVWDGETKRSVGRKQHSKACEDAWKATGGAAASMPRRQQQEEEEVEEKEEEEPRAAPSPPSALSQAGVRPKSKPLRAKSKQPGPEKALLSAALQAALRAASAPTSPAAALSAGSELSERVAVSAGAHGFAALRLPPVVTAVVIADADPRLAQWARTGCGPALAPSHPRLHQTVLLYAPAY
eukprot:COSAG05_NODE_49_length_24373_cov_16.162561_1_plen_208_part_00